MKGLRGMGKIWSHFKTITHHKFLVMQGCFRVGLYLQGICHDLSKYSPSEFWLSAKYYQGYRSPLNAEREDTGVSTVWLHHKGRNKHHYEYWMDSSLDPALKGILVPVPMPKRYIAEMIMDRIAASKVYEGDKYTDGLPTLQRIRITGACIRRLLQRCSIIWKCLPRREKRRPSAV